MSFFGFDTTLPRDKGGKSGGRDSAFDPVFDPTGGIDDDDTLDAKIKALAAGAQEDVEIYTWGQEGYDGLGDKLEEANDELNEDTFGALGDDIAGKDFDFGATTSLGEPSHGDSSQQSSAFDHPKPKRDNKNAFATSLDEFWTTPAPRFGAPPQNDIFVGMQQQQKLEDLPSSQATRGSARTLEEIEAEMLAARNKANPPSSSQPQQPQDARRPLTLEEVEAEMLARRSTGAPPAQPAQPPPLPQQPPQGILGGQPPAQHLAGMPAGLSALLQGQQPTAHQRTDSRGPPTAGYTHSPQSSMALPGMPMPPPMGPGARVIPGMQPPQAPAAMQATAQAQVQAQAEHFARMRALLEATPPVVQQSILALPPPMQFDALESVVRAFPRLLDPSNRDPAAGGASLEEQEAVKFMMEKVQAYIAEMERVETKRKVRMNKIASMARYNGLMSGSDKDFITRIQISQLVTPDPYADDFYAHIYFALRGGPMRPGIGPLPGSAPSQQTKAGKGRQRLNRQQNAMLRMQQQVERIVQNRKERIEKSANGATLEGALGRVSLSSTKNPRQMLQISSDATKKAEDKSNSNAEAVSGARDAIREALAGASLGEGGQRQGADGQKRDPLGRHEVLRILEKLYDTVLALEQLRRNAPPTASSPRSPEGEGKSMSEEEEEALKAWQSKQAALTALLWKELRVLEPLEISDPHPFVSLLSSAKGKRLLPRALRHLSPEQTLTALTMVVASFETLDVVRKAHLLDDSSDDPSKSEAKADIERQTETFANTIVPSMLILASTAPMRIVSGMLALFVERNNVIKVAQTRPGVAFLTIFLSRAESLRQGGSTSGSDGPSKDELDQWRQIFGLLFSRLTSKGQLPSLFPSTRAKAALPFGVGYYLGGGLGQSARSALGGAGGKYRNADVEDEPVWNLMAALAVSASMEQQQVLVQELREKILENVISAKEWSTRNGGVNAAGDELGPDLRIRNVNLLLHALNLDAAQITV
ncbi:hypothetical protein IE53DRAFT_393091 [Violaceomyces palustris]|uniref:Uncharacterized protein n=1 Tax=Violaceomyces palustris TaxID=1673888 RepID=A0ACD0P0X1_9BASI|nr:hypothetical protein IE53DRAFT_393091 [Violaceomyces palustris]